MEKVAIRIVEWIREEVAKAGAKGLVVGISGGLDSSVTAVLCKRAFPDKTLGLIVPCDNDPVDVEHASLLAEKFKIETKTIDLTNTFKEMLKELGEDDVGIPSANLKPRLRMAALYYLANKLNYLVVGTGNKTERTIGYFTKYGDGGVDILPLGDLLKRDVIELAKYLGIPAKIIGKAPSAGMWEGQTDEKEIGLSYDEMDEAISGKKENDKIKKMIEESEHKRKPIPICKIKG
ncbi:MAG: NAD(+) synthase [Candidatus Altiarchaeales archaeon]|nr:NAD(+) synthase [Candidatus Altiarchaeota archaeon]MBU4265885.1 NAD(+) synthase [Candidatus Altiarchaeota archaeon]MBU4341496.1 NAD(+) synthase [Candidatus Altiarchaeota archaeon]MBU4437183.1 NAD(+) synthase [Candidatus Altiarchaeota archaeon]MCG2782399.1 NAD(+) synthase [Candidatus Altiarchaeales archaeon]